MFSDAEKIRGTKKRQQISHQEQCEQEDSEQHLYITEKKKCLK